MSFFQNASNVIASNNNLTAVEGDQIRIDHQINQTTYNYYNLPSNTHEASATGSDLTVAISLTSSKIIAPIKPSVTALFLGRISELNALKERFYPRSRDEAQTRRSLLLYGMGGIGKTQIALRFGEETKHQFSRIFYIDASTVETITRSLKGIYVTTPELQSSKTVDGSSQSVVLDWISRLEEDWLMIYDNADEHVHKFVPSGNRGNILLTSRNRSVGRYTSFNAIEIQQMEEADAISLLLKASCLDQKSPANSPDSDLVKMAERIVTELHCHPLAVDQAGASIESGMCQIDNYLALYSQHRKDFLNDRAFSEASQYEKTVYGTLELSYKEIETRAKSNHSNSSSNLMYNSADIKAAQSALIILHLFAFLHHDSIDEDIFRQASAGYYNWDKAQDFFKPPNISLDGSTLLASNQQGTWDELYFKKGIRILLSFSLIKQSQSSYGSSIFYSVHPLIHSWSRDRMSLQKQILNCADAYTILLSSISFKEDIKDYRLYQTLVPHIKANQQYMSQTNVQSLYNDFIFERLAFVFDKTGSWKDAEEVFPDILEARTNVLGEDHPKTLETMCNFAEICKNQAKWEKAEQLNLQVIDMGVRKKFPQDHFIVLHSMNNLGQIYLGKGRWKDSENIHKQLADIRTKSLGKEHPDTLKSLDNLAVIYRMQGNWTEAQKINIEVVQLRTKILGKDHPDTLNSIDNLAIVYQHLGQWKQAEELYLEELNSISKFLGKEHPHTLTTLNNLSVLYTNQGRWKEAENLISQVWQARKNILGIEHPETLTSLENLAILYRNQGLWEKAEKTSNQVFELRSQVLGNEHPETLASLDNIAVLYRNQGHWKKAEELHNQVFKLRTKVLGAQHPDTLTTMNNLALILHSQGKFKEAEPLTRQILSLRIKILGQEHPKTMGTLNNLATIYSDQGRWKEAEKIYMQLLDLYERTLGKKHPDTFICINNLAGIYYNQKKWKEAEMLNLQVLSQRTAILGREHPDTLISMNSLASVYFDQGRWKEAFRLSKEVLELRIKLLGKEHPFTLTSMSNLAIIYAEKELWKEAEEINMEVVELRTKILGKEHPDTLASMNDLMVVYKTQGKKKELTEMEAEIRVRLK